MKNITKSLLVSVPVFVALACGGDDGGHTGANTSAASSGDCKKANDLAKSCDIDPFDCKEDAIAIACTLEQPQAFCNVDDAWITCIAAKANSSK